ncbi:MAG: hypothetical protein HY001_01715 [Candidatus Portnoybacteria bacterium]|nr:hypothetical protein [Candidatus Portnoybacteria bacterium]
MRIIKNTLSFLSLLSPLLVIAQGSPPPLAVTPNFNVPSDVTTATAFIDILQNILGWAFAFAVVIGVAMLIVAGILYITAGGMGKAKMAASLMIFAIVGIAVAGFAWAIVNVLQNIFFENPTPVA